MRVADRDADTVIPDVDRKDGILQKILGLRLKDHGRALFTFRQPTKAGIDMFLVPRPLEIAFIDEDMQIAEIHGAHPVTLDPDTWRTYRPEKPAKYVLEVEKGMLAEKGVEQGNRVAFLE